jgi:capsular exopolysaccharide synthesis family protein
VRPPFRGGATPDEAYHILRANLLVAATNLERPTIVFTSARAGEGKTSTVVNLGRVMALAGHRVVLVDLDLRHPDLHKAFRLDNERGVSDVIRGRASLEECLSYVEIERSVDAPDQREHGLYILTGGAVADNPSELLGTARAGRLLEALAEQADVVLIDSAPVLPIADTLVLGRLVGGVVIVVEARQTPIPVVQHAKDALTRNQARLLGVVISKMHPQDAAAPEEGQGYE